MKSLYKLTVLIALIILLSFTFSALPAYADGVLPRSVNVYESARGYTLTSLKDDSGKYLGLRFYGLYFGSSNIAVLAEIFSSNNITLDFAINEQDEKLTPSQADTKRRMIALADKIDELIKEIDAAANTQYDGQNKKPTSYVYRYNSAKYGETIEVNEHMYNMLNIARTMYDSTNGAFNPAVYRLVDLWGFSSRIYSNGNFGLPYDRVITGEQFVNNGYPLPDQKYVDAFSASAYTDFSNDAVTLSAANGKYFVTKNVSPAKVDGEEYEQWIDLGGIAKGYAVDGVKSMLTNAGIDRYYVDAGTSSQAMGRDYTGEHFNLGITDPFESGQIFRVPLLSVKVADCTVSTSGQNIRKYTHNGVEYAHIIDGNLGRPAQTGVKALSIVAPQSYPASYGDCLTTALTVMGRDRIVEFMNGYLKDNGIKIVVCYQTVDGQQQVLSNYGIDEITEGDTYDNFAWAIKTNDNGEFVYDFDAKAPVNSKDFTWLLITLGVIVILAVAAVIVTYFVKGKANKTASNVLNAKKDKPFKIGDVGVYIAVVMLIIVLFMAFFGKQDATDLQVIKVVDFSKSSEGELLFVYNVTRNEWIIYDDNSNGWTVEITEDGNLLNVKFTREIDGERHYNLMQVTRGAAVSVKMADSLCGRNKECVRNFGAIDKPNGTIVCSPNRLKVISE